MVLKENEVLKFVLNAFGSEIRPVAIEFFD
jgi:hypothetical protein